MEPVSVPIILFTFAAKRDLRSDGFRSGVIFAGMRGGGVGFFFGIGQRPSASRIFGLRSMRAWITPKIDDVVKYKVTAYI